MHVICYPFILTSGRLRVDIGQALFCVFKDRDDVEVDNQKEDFSCGTNAGNPERARWSEHRNSAITINWAKPVIEKEFVF